MNTPPETTSVQATPGQPQASLEARTTAAGQGSYGFQNASDLITSRLGLESIQGFSLSSFFSEVFRRHDPAEVENLFTVGSSITTPALHKSMAQLPSPWLFFVCLLEQCLFTGCFC